MKIETLTLHAAYQVAAKFAGYTVPEHTPEARAHSAAKRISLLNLLNKRAENFMHEGEGTPTPRGNITQKWVNRDLNTVVVLEGTEAVTIYPLNPTKYWDGKNFLR